MKKLIAVSSIALALLLSACAESGRAEECAFKYDNSIKEKIVLPLLAKRFGEMYVYFDVDRPAILRHGNNVEMLFNPTKTVDGRRSLYENSFVIDLNACTSHVTDSYVAVAN